LIDRSKIQQELPTIYGMLVKHLPKGKISVRAAVDLDLLLEEVEAIVHRFLLHDFSSLLRLMYTADVEEQKFKKALEAPTLCQAAHEISEILIERECLRASFRKS